MGRVLRVSHFYTDEDGRSEVMAQIAQVHRDDPAKGRLIMNKIRLLEEVEMEDAFRSRLIKRPTGTIFVLRAQARGASFRLPFFEDMCAAEPTIILTECVKRPLLNRSGAYKALVDRAEEMRAEWIKRHC